MIVYIEGVDGSGKSTFAKAVTEYLQEQGFKVHPKAEKAMVTHPWRLDRINRDDLKRRIIGRAISKDVFIVDRGELSDIIYRTFDFDKYQSLMSLSEYHKLYTRYAQEHIIIHCDTDRSEELMLKRGEDNTISIVEHHKLRYLFNQIMPLFNAIKFDAAINIKNPSYLNAILANIRMELILRGIKDHG